MKPRLLPFVAVIFSQISPIQGQTINDPIAYYNFDSNFNNQVTGGFTLNGNTLTGAPTISSGIVGNALTLNGSSSLQLTGMGSAVLGNSFSISAWYYQNNATSRMMIFEASSNFNVSYGATGNNSTFRSYVNSFQGGDVTTPVAQWHHVVQTFSFNGTNTILTVYVNGVAQPITPVGGAAGTVQFPSLNLGTYRTADGRYLNGKIDEVALWNRTLSAADVAALYNGGTPAPLPFTPDVDVAWVDANPTTAAITGGNVDWSDAIWKASPAAVVGAPWPLDYVAQFDPITEAPTSTNVSISGNESALGVIFNAPNYTVNGGTLTLSGTSPQIIANQDGTVGSVLVGTNGMSKSGSAKLTLSGANTLTGTTRISGGTLQLDGGNAIADAAPILFDNLPGATILLGANETVGSIAGGGPAGGNINLQNFALTTGENNAVTTTYAGTISGTGGSLVKNGTGISILSGTNTYTGGTIVNAGELQASLGTVAGAKSPFGTGDISVGTGATLRFFAGGTPNAMSHSNNISLDGATMVSNDAVQTYSGNITLTNTNTVNVFWPDKNAILSSTVGGTGSLVKTGFGTLILSGTNSFSGSTSVSGPMTLDYTTNNTSKLPDTQPVTITGTGRLNFTGNASAPSTEVVNGLTLTGAGATLALATATGQTLTADFTGSGSGVFTGENFGLNIITSGTGTPLVKLPGTTPNTPILPNITFNSVTFGSTNASNFITNSSTGNNTATDLSTWTSGATQYVTTGADFTGAVGPGVVIDGITFNDPAARTVTIGNGNTLTLDQGIIVTQNVGNFVSTVTGGSISASPSSALTLFSNNTANGLTINSAIIDNSNSSIVKNGPGAITLGGTNTYAGGTFINGLRMYGSTSSAFGSGAITAGLSSSFGSAYASGGAPFLAMTSTAAATLPNNIVLPNAPSTAYFALQKFAASSTTGTNLEISGVISGGGANTILQLDSPTAGDLTTSFTLSGSNTLAGQIRLNRGAVVLTNEDSLGDADLFVQSNANPTDGNIRFTNSFTLPNDIIFGATNGNTINTNANTVEVSGAISGPANWSKVNGSGTLNLSAVNTGTGNITISAGTLRITGTIFADAFNDKVVTVGSGAVLDLQNWGYDQDNTYSASLGGLTANNTGLVINGGTIRMSGVGSTSYDRGFTITGKATFEAAANVNWTLAESDNPLYAPVYNGSPELVLTGAGDGRFEKVFAGSGPIEKNGSGTWTLTGENTNTGFVYIEQGTLRLDGANGRLGFAIDGPNNNAILNFGGDAEFNAQFYFDLSNADINNGSNWLIVESDTQSVSYENDFNVNSSQGAFTREGKSHTLIEGNNTWKFNEEDGTLSLEVGTSTGYAGWIDGFFPGEMEPAIIGATADPDNDGIANSVEFVLGGNPKDDMDADVLPTLELVTNPGGEVPNGDYLLFTHRRTNASVAANVAAVAQYDTDLTGPWAQATDGEDGVVIIETPNGFETGVDRVEVYIPRAANTKLFGRLSVTTP